MNPMFPSSVYQSRRDKLKKQIKSGVAIFLGNGEASMNYPSNTYRYRQDSNFIYFSEFGHLIWRQ
jgi:Xaa-Pro aminopeptidase